MNKTFEEIVCKKEPDINVISKNVMDERVFKVFKQISETLSLSLGPMGAHAIISQNPWYHVTKDGFTIMKNLRYNNQKGYVDNVIAGMISDICGRLNFAVGDGTTSAVVAAYSMYLSFSKNEKKLMKDFILPRNMRNRLNELIQDIITNLDKEVIDIKTMPTKKMCDNIRDIVYVSSNADKEMTNIIVDLYEQLGFPAIDVTKSEDGITRGKVVSGFLFPAKLASKIYVNNDNNTQVGSNYDVIIFDHKVGLSVYQSILVPLSKLCLMRGRKLICLAPFYDEVALNGDIANDLNVEFRNRHDITLVLMNYKAMNGEDKKRIADFAMLCNTQIITRALENEWLQNIENNIVAQQDKSNLVPKTLEEIYCINIDHRNIPNISVLTNDNSLSIWNEDFDNSKLYELHREEGKLIVDLGFCGNASLSIDKDSVFSDFCYDVILYEKYIKDAQSDLDAAIEKYKKLGTFNFEIANCQKRLLGLKMKMGTIEAGATSEFSREFVKDSIDDAVKAAESAYNEGIVIGSHVSLMRTIYDMIEETDSPTDAFLLGIILTAFKDVRCNILKNGFGDKVTKPIELNSYNMGLGTFLSILSDKLGINVVSEDMDITPEDMDKILDIAYYFSTMDDELNDDSRTYYSAINLITAFEIYTSTCLNLDINMDDDIPTIHFNRKVVNSKATDREILLTSSDLVGLLITGNQLIVSASNVNYAN